MTRTLTTLSAVLLLALAATFLLGWLSFFADPNSVWKKDLFIVHFTLGLLSALGALLVHCLIFTYFLGTGRWVKEVGLAYRLPDERWPRETRELKRTVFPPALYAMLITIATVAAGAGSQLQVWHWGIHLTLATLTLVINVWAFRIEFRCVSRNAALIGEVMVEVDRIRAERGLPSNAEALQQGEVR
jgi:hypothetical protein